MDSMAGVSSLDVKLLLLHLLISAALLAPGLSDLALLAIRLLDRYIARD